MLITDASDYAVGAILEQDDGMVRLPLQILLFSEHPRAEVHYPRAPGRGDRHWGFAQAQRLREHESRVSVLP